MIKTVFKYYFTFTLAVFFLFATNGFSVIAACCQKCDNEHNSTCHHDHDAIPHSHKTACHYYFLKTDETENYTPNYLFNSLSKIPVIDSCGVHSFICFFCVEKIVVVFDTHYSPIPILGQSCILLC